MTDSYVPALSVSSVGKKFGAVDVLIDVSFELWPGEVVGLVGANGAGKTTLFSLICGLLKANSGTIRIFGQRVRCGVHLPSVAFIPDSPAFYPFQTAEQHLTTIARMVGDRSTYDRIQSSINAAGIDGSRALTIGNYSRGMMQRLSWAEVGVAQPRLVVLDEPTSALDPAGVEDMRTFVASCTASNAAVLFSSHNLDEVGRLCDRVLLIANHRVQAEARSGTDRSVYFEIRLRPGIEVSPKFDFAMSTRATGNTVVIQMPAGCSVATVSEMLVARGVDFVGISELMDFAQIANFRGNA